MSTIFLSIIIPTKNRAHLLRKTLQSIQNQSNKSNQYEVIVVNNGSDDETETVVQSFRNTIPNLLCIRATSPGLHVGRHKGTTHSRGVVLGFLDDDVELFPSWIETVLEEFRDEKLTILGGNCIPNFQAQPPAWLEATFNRTSSTSYAIPYLSICSMGDKRKKIHPHMIFGCNFIVRKSIVNEAHGFHPDKTSPNKILFMGDGETHIADYICEHRLKSIFNPMVSVYHAVTKERMTKDYALQRSYEQGVEYSYRVFRKNGFYTPEPFIESCKLIVRLLTNKGALLKLQAVYRYKGFLRHQAELVINPSLRLWVTKKEYN